MQKRINQIFKELRSKANVSQEQFAQFLGLEQSSIRKFESGQIALSVGYLEKACALFGINYSDLINNPSNVTSLARSFPNSGASDSLLKSISDINKIALNLVEMDKISGR